MTRFNSKIGALTLAGFGLVYLVASLALGKSATAQYPPDLAVDNSQLSLSPWQTADFLIRKRESVRVIDVRPPEEYAQYHIPMSENFQSSDPLRVAEISAEKTLIVIANTDDKAGALVAAARRLSGNRNIFYLREGAGGWYLLFDMPIPLFNDQKPPHGYQSSLATIRRYFSGTGQAKPETVQNALATLIRLNYEPTKLGKKKKTKATGKKRKKIAGGCG